MKETYAPELSGKAFRSVRKKLKIAAIYLAEHADQKIEEWKIFISISRKKSGEDGCQLEGCSADSISFTACIARQVYSIRFSAPNKLSYAMHTRLSNKAEGGVISFDGKIFERIAEPAIPGIAKAWAVKRPKPITAARTPHRNLSQRVTVTLDDLVVPTAKISNKKIPSKRATTGKKNRATEQTAVIPPATHQIYFDHVGAQRSFQKIFESIGSNLDTAFLRTEALEWLTGQEKNRKNGIAGKMVALLVEIGLIDTIRGSHLRLTEFGKKVGSGSKPFPDTNLPRCVQSKEGTNDPFADVDDELLSRIVNAIKVDAQLRRVRGAKLAKVRDQHGPELEALEKVLARHQPAYQAFRFICSI